MAMKIISFLFCDGAYPIVMKVVIFNGSRHEIMKVVSRNVVTSQWAPSV
jgi:hypothetical protein